MKHRPIPVVECNLLQYLEIIPALLGSEFRVDGTDDVPNDSTQHDVPKKRIQTPGRIATGEPVTGNARARAMSLHFPMLPFGPLESMDNTTGRL